MIPRAPLVAMAASLALALPAPAQNCSAISVGITPLMDLGAGNYQGFSGGLYGSGQNVEPPAHAQQGLQLAQAVQPLDGAGNPSPGGRIVLLSIGMSNTTQEFSRFVQLSNADPLRSSAVVLVDGAQGGQHAAIVADPMAQFWTVIGQRLTQNGVTPAQVQAVWLKEALPGPTGGFPTHAQLLGGYLEQIARNLKAKYPNVKLCFLSSRIYAGYATSSLNPEPYAYQSAFSVRWTIEKQMANDPTLNFDPAQGPAVAPWLGWGPYLWADGLTPRSDSLVWLCSDFAADGTHPSTSGREKVAQLLMRFFGTSRFATPWYHGPNTSALVAIYGGGCPGSAGVPRIAAAGLPTLGNATFRLQLADAAPGAPALLALSAAPARMGLAGPCTLLVAPAGALASVFLMTNVQGRALFPIPVPNSPGLTGLEVFGQWLVEDAQGARLPPLAGLAASPGAHMRVGL